MKRNMTKREWTVVLFVFLAAIVMGLGIIVFHSVFSFVFILGLMMFWIGMLLGAHYYGWIVEGEGGA
jgi:hypothetical protein